jgi:RNA polymerase sigma-70 factor (ECF subfamily)
MADPSQASQAAMIPEADLRERQLLPRHLGGDETAFAELLEAYRAPVYGLLVRNGIDEAARDDLFQEIFLKVHLAAARYQPDRPLKPWLFTIAVNTVRNHFRDAAGREPMVLTDKIEERLRDVGPNPARAAESRETAAWLEAALRFLPLPHRQALVLTCVEGMDQKEASIALGIPVGTVKTHVRRARIALARALAARRAAPEGKDESK